MSVFRRRQVFRDSTATSLLGGASIVTATCAAAVAFAASPTGSTPGLTGSVSAPVVLSVATITEATLEVSVPCSVVATVTASGIQLTPVAVSAPIVFGVTPRTDVNVTAAVVFASTATVGSTFTMDVASSVAFSTTLTPQVGAVITAPTVFAVAPGVPDVTGGTISTATTGAIAWSTTATGSYGATNNVPDAFFFETVFNADLDRLYTSTTATIGGISVPTLATVANGEVSINGADFTEDELMVEAGDEVRLRHTSSDEYASQVVTSFSINGVVGVFKTITAAAPVIRPSRRRSISAKHRRRAL